MKLLKILNLIKKGRLNTSQGFSLVELMVVVAIIGILAAIAIPNYQKFQARSKQTEARAQLSGIFASARSFIIEWGYGSSNLQQIGYAVESSNMRYNCGWNNAQKGSVGSVNNVNDSNRISGYRGPTNSGDDTKVSTFLLNPGAIATTANGFSAGSWGTAKATDATLSITAASGGTACTWAASACGGHAVCGAMTDATSCGTTYHTFSTEGSLHVNNSVPGSITFIAGCKGDIEGNVPDEWTMDHTKNLLNTVQGI